MTAEEHQGLPTPRRHLAVMALSLGTGMLVVDNAIATIALPSITRSLDITAGASVVVVTVYQVSLLMALLPFSALGDRVGHRRLYQIGQLVFLAASLGSALAVNLPTLLVARCLQALGVAASLSVSSALLRATYPASMLGRGIALNGLIVAVAASAAPTLGGLILSFGSWRWVFATAAPFAVASLLLGQLLPNPKAHSVSFDAVGAALCAAMFGMIMTGLSLVLRGDGLVGMIILALGIPVAAVAVRRELGSSRPVLPVDLLGRATFALPAAAMLFAFCATVSFMVTVPFRLSAAGAPPAAIGAVMAVWPLAMMATAPLAGVLADRAPKGLPGAAGMSLSAVGLITAGLLPADSGFVVAAVPMAMIGGGMGLFMSPTSHLIVGAAPRDRAASAGALVSTTRLIGQALGAAFASAFLATAYGTRSAPAFFAASLALISAGISVFNMLRGGRQRRLEPTEVVDVDA